MESPDDAARIAIATQVIALVHVAYARSDAGRGIWGAALGR